MTTLREKMKQEMTLVGLTPSTQAIYSKAVIKLHDYYNQSPSTLSIAEIRNYLLYLLNDKKLAPNTYNTQIYALRFFFVLPCASRCVNWTYLRLKSPINYPRF